MTAICYSQLSGFSGPRGELLGGVDKRLADLLGLPLPSRHPPLRLGGGLCALQQLRESTELEEGGMRVTDLFNAPATVTALSGGERHN
uniref:Uncharacterized protein n=1 Tax=Knipowitschia caucasica TaxID=637954 RepID=A0AAV2MKU0_KNICA